MKSEKIEASAGLEVLIAYDHVAAGKCAKELCDRLQLRLGSQCEFHLNPWNLAALQFPALVLAPSEDSLQPDLFIIAVDGDTVLPPAARSWLSQWVRRTRAAGGAVVAQFHNVIRMGQELAPAYGDLKRIAFGAHRDFFADVVELADSELADCMNEIHLRAQMQSAALETIPQVG